MPTLSGTSEFDPEVLFPPTKYVRIPSVAVFDEHSGSGAGGKPKQVTVQDLKNIAKSCNDKFDNLGIATPLTIGHTNEDGPEDKQPPIVGYSCNFRIGDLLKTGRKALYCDWYVQKNNADVVDRFPYRSVEWLRSRNDLHPIALLSTPPERDLPPIRYRKSPAEESDIYRYTFTPPTPEASEMTDDVKKPLDAAVEGETSSAKGLAAKVDALTEKVDSMVQMFTQLMDSLESEGQPQEDGDGDDLLKPADGDEDPTEEDKPAKDGKDKAKDKADKDSDGEEPAKFEAGYAGPGNTYTPSTEKTKMARDDEETVAKYERKIAEAVAKATEVVRKENADLRLHYNRSRAKDAVTELEAKHRVDFGTDAEREEELALFADLLGEDRSGEAFQAHFTKVAKKYKRQPEQKPDSAGVAAVARFARTDDGATGLGTVDDLNAYLNAWTKNSELTPEQFAATRSGKK